MIFRTKAGIFARQPRGGRERGYETDLPRPRFSRVLTIKIEGKTHFGHCE